jgi:phosphoglycolate phosphatase
MSMISRVSERASTFDRSSAVIFDLDGTLVDSAGDITVSINAVLAAQRLSPFPVDAILKFIGDGVDALVERAFHARGVVFSSEELLGAIAHYESIYSAQLTVSTKVYAGVLDVISELKKNGAGIGVCTNKTEDKAFEVIKGLNLTDYVDIVVGARRGRSPKPSPLPLMEAIGHFGVAAANAVMVGDSDVDVKCARAADVPIIGVSFGYSSIPMRKLAPDATIESYAEFMPAYSSLKARTR